MHGQPVTTPNAAETTSKALFRAMDDLGDSTAYMSGVLNLTGSTIRNLKRGRSQLNGSQLELALFYLRIYRSLSALMGGNMSQCQAWLRAHNHALGSSPKELMTSIGGLVHVADYLTQCEAETHVCALQAEPWRIVESQTRIYTRHLVDSDEEHAQLEQLIDGVKPPWVDHPPGLHYLLWTPFRYRSATTESRYGPAGEIPVWYGAVEVDTCFYEWATHRFIFLSHTTADLGRQKVPLTAFQAVVRTEAGLDLCVAPFDAFRDRLVSRSSYLDTQRLGRDMRQSSIQAFRFPSARDPKASPCIGVLDPFAFAEKTPRESSFLSWTALIEGDAILFFVGSDLDPLPRSVEVRRDQVL